MDLDGRQSNFLHSWTKQEKRYLDLLVESLAKREVLTDYHGSYPDRLVTDH